MDSFLYLIQHFFAMPSPSSIGVVAGGGFGFAVAIGNPPTTTGPDDDGAEEEEEEDDEKKLELK